MSFWDILDIFANAAGVGTLIAGGVLFLLARRDLKRYLKIQSSGGSERPWAIAVGLPNDIGGTVKRWLIDNELDMEVESYAHAWIESRAEFYQVLHDLRTVKNKLTDYAATEVLLFYKGPVTLAIAIGALYDNWVPMTVYEYVEGTYRSMTMLEKGTVRGMLADKAREAAHDAIRGELPTE